MNYKERLEAYVERIRAGKMTLEQVPVRYRAAVKALLDGDKS